MAGKEMVFEFPGLTARVTRPELSDRERKTRMNTIHREAENLLRRINNAQRHQ